MAVNNKTIKTPRLTSNSTFYLRFSSLNSIHAWNNQDSAIVSSQSSRVCSRTRHFKPAATEKYIWTLQKYRYETRILSFCDWEIYQLNICFFPSIFSAEKSLTWHKNIEIRYLSIWLCFKICKTIRLSLVHEKLKTETKIRIYLMS